MNGRPRGGGQAGTFLAAAAGPALLRRMRAEWQATPFYAWSLRAPKTQGLAAAARDPRPVDPQVGRQILLGRMMLAGGALELGVGGDPWEVASPSRAFAAALHRFAWLPNLLTQGEAGADEALRLVLDWMSQFGRVTPFIWGSETAERRTINLACGMGALMERASEAEGARLVETLARHGRHLLRLDDGPLRRAERACAAATIGAMLSGNAGRRLGSDGLLALVKAMKTAVLPDGSLKTRNPEQGLELLFDLLILDDVLMQRGREAPPEVSRSLDRLTQAVRFFTLGGGQLTAFQGGGAVSRKRTDAALARDDGEAHVPSVLPHAGYQRLKGRTLEAVIDAAPPASGVWSLNACPQPLAIEIACGSDRLITNVGWSADAQGPDGLRLTAGGSTASLGEASCGQTLKGFAAFGLGRRLIDGPRHVAVERRQNEAGVWLELSHDGWARFGISHQRRLFLNPDIDELRGEDHFAPKDDAKAPYRATSYTVRFHLPPELKVSLARDKRSVLLRGPSNQGWWFRNDAPDVLIEPSVHFEDHLPKRCAQIVLKGPIARETGARVRWKLAPVEVDSGVRAPSPGIAQ